MRGAKCGILTRLHLGLFLFRTFFMFVFVFKRKSLFRVIVFLLLFFVFF